ncbi:enoyl-CoA hydratase-related protein [Streptomyces thermocarboxydus]
MDDGLPSYTTLHVTIDTAIARITLDNPPVNVLGGTLVRELHDLLGRLRDDRSVRVIVFSSADPEFFLAHVDIHILDEMDDLRRSRTEPRTSTSSRASANCCATSRR